MKNLNNIASDLFNKIRGRFPSVTIGDQEGVVTTVPEESRFYDFAFTTEGATAGKVSVSLDEENGVTVVVGKDVIDGFPDSVKEKWFEFLRELRQFAKKRMMQFDVRDISKSNLQKRDYQHLVAVRPGENTMAESKMYGTHRTSYQKIGNARLAIKHTVPINTESATARTQKIGSIFIESPDGERYRYPFAHLSGARAMARHVAEGGTAYDDFGKHISGLSEELSKLRKFSTYMNRSGVMAETLGEYSGIVKERAGAIRKEIQNLQKETYYRETVEGFTVPIVEDVPDDVSENWIDQLTIKQFNEELKDVFPYIYKLVGEATKAKNIGPEDLEEAATIDANVTEDRYRSNNKFQVAIADYNNFKIYVSKDRTVQNQFLATAISNASGREADVKSLANKADKAVAMVKQKLDDTVTKAEKVTGNAMLDFNVMFTRDFFANDAEDLGVENPKTFFAKVIPGPALVIANMYEFNGLEKLLTDDGFARGGNRSRGNTAMIGVGLTASKVQAADLVANGRYLLGKPTQDSDKNYVYPMKFDSIVMDKNDALKFGSPAVTVGSARNPTESVWENEIENTFEALLGQFSDHMCEDCGKLSWKTLKMSTEQIEEGERHGNSKVYDKCWKGYKKVPGKSRGEKGSCVKEHYNNADLDEAQAPIGTMYMRFKLAAVPGAGLSGKEKQKNATLMAWAGFANTPEEMGINQPVKREFRNLSNMEALKNAVRKIMTEKVFVKTSKLVIFHEHDGLFKRFPYYEEFIEAVDRLDGDKVTVQYKDKLPPEKREKGIGKKREKYGHVPDSDVVAPEKTTTTYFRIDNPRLMAALRQMGHWSIQSNFRPALKMFVMEPKEFEKFRAFLKAPQVVDQYGRTMIQRDASRSFAETDVDTDQLDREPEKPKTPLGEFILSYFDRESGKFPKGETAVLTAVEKDYGDQYVEPARQFIEQVQITTVEYIQREASQSRYPETEMVKRLAGM